MTGGRRPKPHIDTSPNEESTGFTPTFISASEPTKYIKVAMHGDNGTGKTRAAGTYPKPIILATDPGFTVLRQLPNSDDIHVAPIADKWGTDDEGKRILEQGALSQVWDYYRWLTAGDHDRETVVVDSITEIHKMVLDAVMRKPRQGREAPTIPCTDDYIEVASKMKTLIRYFRDLPMHVVFTAHSKTLKKRDDIIGIKPDLSDKLCTELGGACDVVMHTMVLEKADENAANGTQTFYVGQTVPLNGVMAKDRSDQLRKPAAYTDFPTIAKAFGIPFDAPAATSTKSKAKATADTAPDPDAGEPEAPE